MYHCPQGCTLTRPSVNCANQEGERLFAELQWHTDHSKQVGFYDLPSAQRHAFWRSWNKAANTWLQHIQFGHDLPHVIHTVGIERYTAITYYSDLARKVLLAKYELIRSEENEWQCDKIMEWVKDTHSHYSEIDNGIEEQQMGFDYDTQEWRNYSQLYGVVNGDLHCPYTFHLEGV